MAKFLRVGHRGINLSSIQYYELSGNMGSGLGRAAPSTATASNVSLVLFLEGGAKLAITDPTEAREVLSRLEHL
ncbi:MAG: hypothetical protein ACK41E_06915 [Deinococcales bacterium]